MKKLLNILAIALFAINTAKAQPSIQWQKCLGGSGSDVANSIQQTSDGGYIIAGYTTSNDGDVTGNHGGYSDFWVVKLNASGQIQWQKCLGGSGDDEAQSIQQTSDGGYIVAGYTYSNNGDVMGNHDTTGNNADYWVVKLNSTGQIQWQKCLGGSGDDHAYSIQQTSDGGYIVAGYTESNNGDVTGFHGYTDYWVVKLYSAGNIQWQKDLGGYNYDEAYSIQQTNDSGYIVAGYTESNDGDVTGNHVGSIYPYDYWIVKLNYAGIIQWQKCLGGSWIEEAYSIQQTSDGGYIVAGYARSNDGDVTGNHHSYYSDYWVVKLNSAGTLQWQKCLGGSGDDEAQSIRQTSDGGYIVAGRTGSNDGDVTGFLGGYDYWIVKINSAGTLQWQKCLGGSGDDEAQSIQQTSDFGYIVAGFSTSNNVDVTGNHGGTYPYDYWIVKLSPFTMHINIQPSDFITCVSGNAHFSVTVTGSNLIYQWQESPDSGLTWNNLNNGGIYNGADSSTLALNNVPVTNNGFQYRCIINDFLGYTLTSNAATLTVGAIIPPPPIVSSPVHDCFSIIPNTLTATGNNLLWYYLPSGGTGTSIAPRPVTTVLDTTIFYVSQTFNGCESPRDSIVVIIAPLHLPYAAITANGPTSFCYGDSVSLFANTGASLTYQWRNNGVDILGATDTLLVAKMPGNYYVQVKDSDNCPSISNAQNIITLPCGNSANDFPCAKLNGYQLFGNDSTGIKTKSVTINGNDSTFWNYHTINSANPNCCRPNGIHWLGAKIVKQFPATYLFFTANNDTLTIYTYAQLADTFNLYNLGDTAIIKCYVSSIKADTVFGFIDTVKTFTLFVTDNYGNPVAHPFNNEEIKIGKQLGLIRFFDNIPAFPNCGFTDMCGSDLTPYGCKNLSYHDVYNYDIGDEFHIENKGISYCIGDGSGDTKTIRKVINKIINSGTKITYTYEDCVTYYNDDGMGDITIDTTLSINTEVIDFTTLGQDINYYMPDEAIDNGGMLYTMPNLTFNSYRKYKEIPYWDMVLNNSCTGDTCYESGNCPWPDDDYYYTYIDGCGQFYDGTADQGCMVDYIHIQYYKKGSETWGTPFVNYCDTTGSGTSEINQSNPSFIIFPNPANEVLSVKYKVNSTKTEGQYMIYDVMGQMLLNGSFAKEEFQINISSLAKGIYLLKVEDEEGVVVKRFVKE